MPDATTASWNYVSNLRLMLFEFLNNQPVAVYDFIVGIAVDIVGAEHQNDQPGFEAFQLAILHPPQHALGGIAANAEIGGFQRRKSLVPHGFAGARPQIRDGVADEQQVDLIAMSTHGHRYLSDLLHGATADRVRHLVKIPVLLLRAQ